MKGVAGPSPWWVMGGANDARAGLTATMQHVQVALRCNAGKRGGLRGGLRARGWEVRWDGTQIPPLKSRAGGCATVGLVNFV